MKSSYVLLLAALAAGFALGEPPAGQPLVLLLDDFKIVEGVVERTGAEYVVRRGKDVRRIPAKQVLFAGESLPAVQQYLRTRATGTPARMNAEVVRHFIAKVQPVLANSCANCHARPDHVSGFKLQRVTDGYANAEGLQRNAAAAAAVLNREEPAASALLTKAVTAHGGQREPGIRNREHPAFRNLEIWVRAAASSAGPPSPVAKTTPDARTPPSVATPRPSAEGDPYDPLEFNRAAQSGLGTLPRR